MTDKKTVLITGSTRGIGLALATFYRQQGWNVIGAARHLDKADQLRALEPYKVVQLDASDDQSIRRAAEQLQGEPIDLLINNAGIGANESLETTTKSSLLEQFEVNAIGPFLVTQAFLPHLRAAAAKRGSSIVAHMSSSIGSLALLQGGGLYGYRASKTALNMINACLAHDLKQDKIIAIALNPGYVATEMSSYAGPLQPEESVAGMAKVLAEVTVDDTGKFIQYDGDNLPW